MSKDNDVAGRIINMVYPRVEVGAIFYSVDTIRDAIAAALSAAREEGRLAGLEEAAKVVADQAQSIADRPFEPLGYGSMFERAAVKLLRSLVKDIRSRQTPTGTGEAPEAEATGGTR